jgi:hypothetical protein
MVGPWFCMLMFTSSYQFLCLYIEATENIMFGFMQFVFTVDLRQSYSRMAHLFPSI